MAKGPGPRPKTYQRLQREVHQDLSVRRHLYLELEKQLGKGTRVVTFFTSFWWPVVMGDDDADMLEELLHNAGMEDRQLVLVVNSPGGEALAAERIVNICRSFGRNGQFSVIVPKMAKSAATMVCFGAAKITMSRTSELGPIDPQIPIHDDDGHVVKYLAAHEIVDSYTGLMKQANTTRGRVDPFLQQLARFDARDIQQIKSAQQLSESIAIRSLQTGCLAGLTDRQIKRKIRPFLDPRYTKVHGRPIYYTDAQRCGLNVEFAEIRSPLWRAVWNLYIRVNHVVTSAHASASKVLEWADDGVYTPAPRLHR